MIECGDLVRDKITGFTGVVICLSHYQFNSDRAGVRSRELKDGCPGDAFWFDVFQLEIVEKAVIESAPCGKMTLEYGDVVCDIVSGFKGKVTGHDVWSNGCLRYHVETGVLHEGKPLPFECFPGEQLNLVWRDGEDVRVPRVRTGGPMPAPSCVHNPR